MTSGSASSSSRARTATATRSAASSWPAPRRCRCGTSRRSLDGVAAVVLPGGFAYGDYLRAGVIARFSPVMRAVSAFAAEGGLVLGICNGFQVLAEAGLVPGALLRNRGLRFLGRDVADRARSGSTRRSRALVGDGRPLRMPIAHGEGCYFADDATLDALERDGQVLFRYVDADGTPAGAEGDPANPNGIAARDRRRAERARQRRRPDAPPGARGGGAPRLGRRAADPALARRGRRARRARRGARAPRRALVAVADDVAERAAGDARRAAPPCRSIARSALTDDELDAIRDRLGRDPNDLELAMFSVMWSEHCSYKSSRPLLRTLPTRRRGRRRGPGRERRRRLDRRRAGRRVQDRIAQPPERRRAVPGRRDRRRRHPARHLHDGRAPDRGARRAPLRRSRRTRGRGTSSTASCGASAATATASACRRSAASSSSTRRTPTTRSSTSWRSALLEERAPDAGRGARARQPRRPVRERDRPRRDRRSVGPRVRDVRATTDASKRPSRPGRRPVRREAAHRGVARADRARARRGPPGPRRGGHHLRDVRDGRSGRHRASASTSTRSRGASRAWRRSR